MVDMMDEQSFHGLEDYSFFFPLHCLHRRVDLISQRVTEKHQAMCSLLQLSGKMKWTEYQIDLKRSRNVSSLPSSCFLSFLYQLCKCIHITCLISNVKTHCICTYICLPVTSEQCYHLDAINQPQKGYKAIVCIKFKCTFTQCQTEHLF